MDKDIVEKIIEASNIIINNTNDDDTLIFIGQSPNLMYHIVKKYRRSFEMPFSGSKFNMTEENKILLKNVLNHYKITKEILKNNIFLIDYCETGITFTTVSFILNNIFRISKIFNIIYWTGRLNDITNPYFFNKKIHLNKLMDVSGLEKLINFEYYFNTRTIPKCSSNIYSSHDELFCDKSNSELLDKFHEECEIQKFYL